jgi:hypothetical protein
MWSVPQERAGLQLRHRFTAAPSEIRPSPAEWSLAVENSPLATGSQLDRNRVNPPLAGSENTWPARRHVVMEFLELAITM